MQHLTELQSEHSVRHQSALLRAVLRIMLLFSLAIGMLNVFVFHSYLIASFNFISFAAAAVLLMYFNDSAKLKRTSWLACIAVIFNVVMFINIAEGQNYSILWVMIVPPIVFFLLGRRNGALLTALLFAYTIFFISLQIDRPQPETLGLGALLNVIEVCFALWFIYRFYEGSRETAYRELKLQSITDKLTGLYNRSYLDTLLSDLQLRMQGGNLQQACIVIADIDHFKEINDRFGHIQGDKILQETAALLRDHTRERASIGRWGCDEFLLILPEFNLEEARAYCEDLRQTIATDSHFENLTLTMSFGVASYTPAKTIEQMLIFADRALYAAKQSGRNRVEIATA